MVINNVDHDIDDAENDMLVRGDNDYDNAENIT